MEVLDIKFSRNDLEKSVILPKEITTDVAYFCGLLAGDGHIEKNYGGKCRHVIRCEGNQKDEIEFYDKNIKELVFRCFNIKVKPRYFMDTYGIKFTSRAIVHYLNEMIGLPRRSKYETLRIPETFKSDRKLLCAFVRGLFDTDFSFCLIKKYRKDNMNYYPQICFVSKSESFTKEIWQALKLLGLAFNGRVYKVVDPDPRAKAGYTITYRFDMYGHKYFIQILTIIELRHLKHLKKYEEWWNANKNNQKLAKLGYSGGWI